MNSVDTDLRIYLKPFRISKNRPLVMGLFTPEPKGGLVEVEAIPDEWHDDIDVGLCVDRDDVLKCLRAISSGKNMTFMLLESLPPEEESFVDLPPKPIVQLPLINDGEFKRLFDQQYERVATAQDATRARQLGEGWYRRRSPFK